MKIFYAACFVIAIASSSCTKEPVKPVKETPEESIALLSRVFSYTDPNQKDSVGYTTVQDSIHTTASIKPSGELLLSTSMPFSKGRDYVEFTFEQAKLKPGYVGSYELKRSQLSGLQGDVQNVYGYRRDQYAYTELGAGNAEGVLTITGYDAQKKSLKGAYQFSIHSFHDPKVGMNWQETNISITGEFEKVLLP